MEPIAHQVSNSKSLYVALPRRLLWHPPISHNGSGSRLTAYEFAVLAEVLSAAWDLKHRSDHNRALKAGKQAIERERAHGEDFREDWEVTNEQRRAGKPAAAPKRDTTRTTGSHDGYHPRREDKLIKGAGRDAYKRAMKKLRKQTPGNLKLTRSRYEILRRGGLSDNDRNLRGLDAALDRLCQPVGDDNEPPHAPPLLGWKRDSGRLLLEVAGEWLAPGYGQIPLPLPLRSATALALYLLAHSLEPYPMWRKNISFAKLYDRLGMQCGRMAARRLSAAVRAVNEHLATKIDAPALHDAGVKQVLLGCDIAGGRAVHIKTVYYDPARQRADAVEPATTPKRKRTRRRPHYQPPNQSVAALPAPAEILPPPPQSLRAVSPQRPGLDGIACYEQAIENSIAAMEAMEAETQDA